MSISTVTRIRSPLLQRLRSNCAHSFCSCPTSRPAGDCIETQHSPRRGTLRDKTLRSRLYLTDDDLKSTSVFPKAERILQQRLAHVSTQHRGEQILTERRLRASLSDDNAAYAGDLELPCVFATPFPESDGVFFPFSTYPKSESGHVPLNIFTFAFNERTFPVGPEEQEYTLFYVCTTPTLYGPRYMSVYRSVVVLARNGSEEFTYCEQNFLRFSHLRSRILFQNPAKEFLTAVQFAPDDLRGTSSTARPHQVVIAIAGDVQITDDMELEVISGNRLVQERGGYVCPVPGCKFSGLFKDLKRHYRSAHTDSRPFVCTGSNDTCTFAAATHVELRRHQSQVHEGVRYVCPHCPFWGRRQATLNAHKRGHSARMTFFGHDGS